MATRSCTGWRRRYAAIAGAIVLAGTAIAPTIASAQEENGSVEPGAGDAYAQAIRVDPKTGELSFGVTFGQSLALHQNTLAAGEARSLDLGVIGTTLAGEGCSGGDPTLPAEDQPQPLSLRTDEHGNTDQTNQENGVTRRVAVDAEVPLGQSWSTTADIEIPGLVKVAGAQSHTQSGIIDGKRTARAVSTVGSITVAGLVTIKGLRWEAVYISSPEVETITDFTIDGVTLAGTNLPIPGLDTSNIAAVIDTLNGILEPTDTGIRIDLPVGTVEEGIATVSPLRITAAPGGIIATIVSELGEVRTTATAALLGIDCSFGTVISVADIALNSITGAGSLNLELGGVDATSGEFTAFEFPDFAPPAPPPAPPAPPATTGGSAFTPPDFSSTPSTGGTTPLPDPVDDEETEVAVSPETEPAASVGPLGLRGGPLLGVGLGALFLLGALAEGDRRKMRKAQRNAATGAGR